MKVRFYCDSGANIHSRREDILDVENHLGMTPEEWTELSDEKKEEMVREWAYERLEYGWTEA